MTTSGPQPTLHPPLAKPSARSRGEDHDHGDDAQDRRDDERSEPEECVIHERSMWPVPLRRSMPGERSQPVAWCGRYGLVRDPSMSGRESVLKRPTPPPESFRFVIGRQYSRAGAPERHRDDTAHVPCSAHGRRVGRLPAPRSPCSLRARAHFWRGRSEHRRGATWRLARVGERCGWADHTHTVRGRRPPAGYGGSLSLS
jgi:hypothetical protein